MMGDMLTNATSAVLSLPGYYLQKKDPGLYDLMTNGVLQGKFDFDDARSSCEAMVETMGEMNTDKAYGALARAEAWTHAVKSGDAIQAKEDVLKDMGTRASPGSAAPNTAVVTNRRLTPPPMPAARALRCLAMKSKKKTAKGSTNTGTAKRP
ncbi:hypothetical protein ACVT98_26645 (plasmid) [Vibrio campbellii]